MTYIVVLGTKEVLSTYLDSCHLFSVILWIGQYDCTCSEN